MKFVKSSKTTMNITSKKIYMALAIFGSIGLHSALAQAAENYVVESFQRDKYTLKLMLELPPRELDSQYKLYIRGEEWGLKPQISSVQCDGKLLPKEKGYWLAPADCRQVSWLVHVLPVKKNTTDVSEQKSIAFANPDWILLSEPTSLLRIANLDEPGRIYSKLPSLPLVGGTPLASGHL
ncbi:hypothetical protein [Snodgrassella sp. CFCC 13594]|uniref:hypothetical protein n=1 Tax=Snodgrassella sp. CFCC 13594 TaxID=1775559 RepID=UPI00082A5454|nr:hypothetical protein [Snodgrassella sp. CFCC 13594]